MNRNTNMRFSVLASAIGLACGSLALAGEGIKKEYETPPMQPDAPLERNMDNAQRDMNNEDVWSDSDHSNSAVSAEEQVDRPAKVVTDGGKDDRFLDESTISENDLSAFVAAIETAGLANALTDGTAYTVFAPTDEALKSFKKDNDEISDEQLREVLRSHIVAGEVDAEMVRKLDTAQVLTGNTVTIEADGEKIEIAEAQVVTADIRSGSLTIHTIDAVIEPSAVAAWSEEADSDDQEEAE